MVKRFYVFTGNVEGSTNYDLNIGDVITTESFVDDNNKLQELATIGDIQQVVNEEFHKSFKIRQTPKNDGESFLFNTTKKTIQAVIDFIEERDERSIDTLYTDLRFVDEVYSIHGEDLSYMDLKAVVGKRVD